MSRSHCLFLIDLQARQLESEDTADKIMGVMIESNLVEGRQDIPLSGPAGLIYGQSVTDACVSWEATVKILDRLREGVRGRRETVRRLARGLQPKANAVSENRESNGSV